MIIASCYPAEVMRRFEGVLLFVALLAITGCANIIKSIEGPQVERLRLDISNHVFFSRELRFDFETNVVTSYTFDVSTSPWTTNATNLLTNVNFRVLGTLRNSSQFAIKNVALEVSLWKYYKYSDDGRVYSNAFDIARASCPSLGPLEDLEIDANFYSPSSATQFSFALTNFSYSVSLGDH